MADTFLKQQLEKILEGKVLLILSTEDFEELVLAAVPNLQAESNDLESTGDFSKAQRLQRIANELDTSPTKNPLRIINLSTSVH